jgi:hypothetical protein
MTAGFKRLHGDKISDLQIENPLAAGNYFSRQLVAKDHRVFDAGQRMRRGAGGDRTVVNLMQIAAADPVVQHPQFDIARTRLRFRHRLESHVASTMVNGSAHESPGGANESMLGASHLPKLD